MKKCIPPLLLLFAVSLANAATINIGPGDTVNWANVAPGDTIQLSAGNYSGGFQVKKSGTADKPITIKGPASGTAKFTSGWDVGSSNYVVVDGGHASPYGISVDLSASNGGDGLRWGSSANVTNLTFKYVELIGTPKTSGLSVGSYGANLAPGDFQRKNLLLSHCRLYQWCEAFRANKWLDCVIEYNDIRKTQTDNIDHSDIIYSYPSENVTWRWNMISESPEDGMFHEFGGAKNFKFYGNVYWNTRWHMIFFKAPGTYGPVFFYNNVFAGKSAKDYGYISKSSSTMASGTQLRNNIFLNVTNDFPGGDYNCYVPSRTNGYDAPKEAHGIVTDTDPFVNAAAGDFHLSAAGKTLLAGKGQALAAEFNRDMDGNVFDPGAWDIGAFVASGGGASPTPTASPSPSASPSATPTPPAAKFAVGDSVKTIQETNIRSTPAGTQTGTQATGASGEVKDGPQAADLNGGPVTWYKIDFASGSDGWCGDDNLVAFVAPPSPSPSPSASPTPKPSPTATPAPSPSPPAHEATFELWIEQLNTWIRANPPEADPTPARSAD